MALKKKPKKTGASSNATVGGKVKGAILELAEGLGMKKSAREEMVDQQKMSSDIIAETQKLRARLQQLSFKSKKFPEEQLLKDQRMVTMLIVKLDDSCRADGPDTRTIDETLFKICDQLQEAYRTGDVATAHYIMEVLTYGIINGHKALTEMEKDHEAEVMERREKKLYAYFMISQAAVNMYQCDLSVKSYGEKFKVDLERLKEERKAVKEFQKEHPKAMEDIQNAGGHLQDLGGDAFELANMMQNTVRTFKECELLKKEISIEKAKFNDYNSQISQMEISLSAPNEQAKEELQAYAKELGKELLERTNEQMSDVLENDKILTAYYSAMDSVFQQSRVQDYVLSALDRFEEMEQFFAEEEAAAGRMRARALENEQENEEEQEYSYFNE